MTIYLGISGFIAWLLIDTGVTQPNILIPGIAFVAVLGIVGFRVVYLLLKDVKWVRFENSGIRVYNILRLKHIFIIKQDIQGYTAREYIQPQNIDRRSIIIHFKSGKNLEFVDNNYWSFQDLEKYISEHIKFIGEETHKPKIWAR